MKNVNLDADQFKNFSDNLILFFKKHAPIIFILAILLIYGFLFFQINNLSTAEPSQQQINEQQNLIKRLRVDESAVSKIKQLEDQNVSVQSLFKTARDNPFKDN